MVAGSFAGEGGPHRRFAHPRRVGEWPGEDLLGFIVSEGRPWGPGDDAGGVATSRLERDAYELARQAAAIQGESIVVYASRVVRERARADLLENAREIVEGLESGAPAPGRREREGG